MNKKNIKNKNTKFFNHLHKVKKRHVEKFLHTRMHTHHTMIHIGELLVIGVLWFSSLLFANYNNSYIHLHRSSVQEIKQSLIHAIEQKKPDPTKSRIISVWEMDWKVNNTFAQWYCTYWAARISPEFFPYSEDKMSQERTRWGNAIDRCENAKEAWFKIGNTPAEWALIVYSKVGNNTQFWHVGKVMFYNKQYQSLIIRDMNRIWLYIMTDRWEDATTKTNNRTIKCYIYPQVKWNNEKDNTKNETTDKFDIDNTKDENKTDSKINDKNSNEDQNQNNTHNAATEENTLDNNQENNEWPIQDENIEEIVEGESIKEVVEEEKIIYEEEKDMENEKDNRGSIKISINDTMNNISDITKHFLSIYDIEIVIAWDKEFSINNNMLLNINIINKQTKESYEWILPFMINIITQNNIIESNISTLQLSNNNWNTIKIMSKEKWSSNIILTIDNEKIATIPVTVN